MPDFHSDGFSTKVRIHLEVNGQSLRVSQVGQHSLILRDVVEIEPATDATLTIMVDDNPRVYPIYLRDGVRGEEVFFQDRVMAATLSPSNS